MTFKLDPKFKFFPMLRLGNKTQDIKKFYEYLPFENIDNVIEPFGGSFAVIRNVYNDSKYHKLIAENDKSFLSSLDQILGDTDKWERFVNEVNSEIFDNEKYKYGTHMINFEKKKECQELLENIRINYGYEKQMVNDLYCPRGTLKRYSYQNLEHLREIYKQITIYDDYKTVMELHKDNPNSYIFVDPPYILSDNMKYKGMDNTNGDKVIVDNTEIYIYLTEFIKECKCKIMIIINDCALTQYLFKGYIKDKYKKTYQLSQKRDTLAIITNY